MLSLEIQMPSGGRRPMGHRLQQFLPFGRIIESKKSLDLRSTNTCHSNRSMRRTRMRSRAWGSKEISVGLYVPLLG